MTSSRSEFVQNAIDSVIASRSIDVYEYLNGPRRPILEQPEPQDTPIEPVQETVADSVTRSTRQSDLQEAIDYATKSAVNAPTVDVYGYLEKANPVAAPIEGDKQTPAEGLNQETLPLSDSVQNAIQSAINSGGIDSQSYVSKSIETAPEMPASEAPAEIPVSKAPTEIDGSKAPAEVPTTEDFVTEAPTTEAPTTEAPAAKLDFLTSQNAAVIDSQDISGDIIDESINNKLSNDTVPSSTLSAIDDGAREPQHSEVDSGRRSPVTTSDFGNEIDNALENAINTNDNVVVPEDKTLPPPPPKEAHVPLDTTNDETKPLEEKKTTDKEELKDSAKAVAAAVGASVAATTAGVAASAREKKDKLKAKVNETVDKVVEPTKSGGLITDDPLSQPKETDISDQSIPQEQAKPTPPIQSQDEPIASEPIPPPPEEKPTVPSQAPLPPQPTPPEPAAQKEPPTEATEVPASAPEPPSKHHHHHKLLPNRPGHHDEEKGKKCLIM